MRSSNRGIKYDRLTDILSYSWHKVGRKCVFTLRTHASNPAVEIIVIVAKRIEREQKNCGRNALFDINSHVRNTAEIAFCVENYHIPFAVVFLCQSHSPLLQKGVHCDTVPKHKIDVYMKEM